MQDGCTFILLELVFDVIKVLFLLHFDEPGVSNAGGSLLWYSL